MQAFRFDRIRAVVTVSLLAIAGAQSAGAVEFTRSYRVIPSVAGGLTGWAGYLSKVWPQEVDNGIAAGFRLQRAELLLDQYVHRDLDDAILARIDQEFQIYREKGVKVIPRVSYDDPTDSWTLAYRTHDAPLDQVLRHINQLAPILQRHSDIIAAMQAGFVGSWGEWHSSSNGLDREPAASQIRDALLAVLPATVPLQFRNPVTVRGWYADPQQTPAAPTGTARSRIGVHNDCMLSGSDDSYTFPEQSDYDYTSKLGSRGVYGGETCMQLQPREQCSEIRKDGRNLGLAYLNFYGAFSWLYGPSWKAQGCYDEVVRSVGPRIELVSVDVDPAAPSTVRVNLRNTGWSAIFDNRNLAVRLTDAKGRQITRVIGNVRPQDWKPGTEESAPVAITIPLESDAEITPGQYQLALGLPDAAPSLATNVNYMLPFANDDDASRGQALDAATGYFSTGLTIEIR